MIFDHALFDDFRKSYGVKNIEEYIGDRFEDPAVHIEMPITAFFQMVRDLYAPSNINQGYFRTVFDIDKLDASDGAPLVAKFDMERHDLETVKTLAEKLRSDFPDRVIVFIPKNIDIEALGAEGLTALRDKLNSVIESLDYDNIMGFK